MLLAVSFTAQCETLEDTMDILKWVESEHNPEALGDYRDGEPTAFGILQIRQAAITDVNKYYGTSYTIEDAFDIQKSEDIFIKYTTYWADKICWRDGRDATTEDIVRIWNGGPRGYKKHSTEWYLKKYFNYRKNRYLCYNEKNPEQPEMYNQWEARDSYAKIYAYRRCAYLYNS
jgi:hypothetical protein